ncbi:hypothetical protein CSOJ01_04045 [Colletotrichum sojae]|uniref:Zn(2)-C6 fungal-type domain-containing protein n=1 Tax=Colletotrichum sojae TaxID=2175907 RepID=A0A8H6JJQ1_9PEZI|nr:hypothetical protein CSOJ01_04045 [Colletotrichum sojae]
MRSTTRRRPMTFTGCWTCKKRKVKCDERPPRCGNCEKMKITCGGYGVKLQWINVANPFEEIEKPRHNKDSRGRIRIGRTTGPTYHMGQIDQFLEILDLAPDSRSYAQAGPFAMFSVSRTGPKMKDGSGPSNVPSKPPEPRFSVDETSRPTSSKDRSKNTAPEDLLPLAFMEPTISINTEDGNPGSPSETDVVSFGASEEQEHHILPSPDMETTGSDTLQISSGSTYKDVNLPSYSLSPKISGDPIVDKLMHHYAEHVTVLLQPIQHPQNPYRQLYIPAALEAASGWLSGVIIAKATVQSVIFHSLVASSAFHLWGCTPSQTKLHLIGARHHQQALRLLQSAIGPDTLTSEYKMLMVAMLSLFMSGCEADFAIHLQGTAQLRKQRRRWQVISRPTRQLNEISDFLCLLARTVSFSTLQGPWLSENDDDLDEPIAPLPQSDCCFGYMFGITPEVAAYLRETCRLAEYLSWYEQSGERIPDGLLEACENLGDRLCGWSFETEGGDREIPDGGDAREIFMHHSNAWHLAAVVYYHRRIQKCHSEGHDQIIARIAEYMHGVEDIKERSSSGNGQKTAPIMWPAFVASCDARVRGTWEIWWERASRYRLANYQRQWEIVKTIWTIKDEMEKSGRRCDDWIEVFMNLSMPDLTNQLPASQEKDGTGFRRFWGAIRTPAPPPHFPSDITTTSDAQLSAPPISQHV